MSAIRLEAVGFHYESPYASVFRDVDLRLEATWRTGLVGPNGRGKSTLLGLIEGRLHPQQGRIDVPVRPRAFAPLDDGASGPARACVRAAVAPFDAIERAMQQALAREDDEGLARYGELALEFERVGGYTIDHRLEEEWAAMGLPADALARDVRALSGGERTRASIVALFLRRDGYALIDEPTNHLDRAARERLADYLAGKPGFLLASHDRALLDRCCDHFVALEPTGPRVHRGDYASLRAQQRRETEHEEKRRENLAREVKDLAAAARERRGWSAAREKSKRGAADKGFVGARAARQMKRALHVEQRAEAKWAEKRALLRIPDKVRTLSLAEPEGPETVLVAEGLGVDVEGRRLIDALDLVVRRGERIAVVGPNGCGKTLLLETLAGARPPARGQVTAGRGVVPCVAAQIPRWRRGPLVDHLRAAGLDETAYRHVMGCLGVEGDAGDRPIETWSAGERRKGELARSFLAPERLRIWDEPLDYLDIESRERIEAAVLRDRPTLVFVEHDGWFVDRVATRVLRLGPGGPAISSTGHT